MHRGQRPHHVREQVMPRSGNDKTHASASGEAAARLIPGAELFALPIEDQDVPLIPFPEWAPHEPALALAAFMQRHARH